MRLHLVAMLFALSIASVHAQELTFKAEAVTGSGKVTPQLTWSTDPAASSCTASGATDWAGAKAASGSVTLEPIAQSATYTLVCTWPGIIGATISWTAPTTNTDGSALPICPADNSTGNCLLKFRLSYGKSPTVLSSVKDIGRNVRTWSLPELSGGVWYFSMQAVRADGVASAPTAPPKEKRTDEAATVSRTVGIVVKTQPSEVPFTVQ